MDLANAKLVPTQEAPNIGTDVANARLMPTREATKVGTILANAKPMPTSGAVTWDYSRRHECVNRGRTLWQSQAYNVLGCQQFVPGNLCVIFTLVFCLWMPHSTHMATGDT